MSENLRDVEDRIRRFNTYLIGLLLKGFYIMRERQERKKPQIFSRIEKHGSSD